MTDELDARLRRRLEVLSDAVPVPAAPAPGRGADPRGSMAARRWYPGLGALAALGLLLLAGGWGLLFLGGEVSGILQTVGGPLPPPPSGMIGVGGDGGYWDTPCADTRHCPSPVPTIDPAVAPKAVAVRVPSLEIPIDHTGHHAIHVGTAELPNGILTEASMTLVDNIRPDIRLEPSGLDLRLVGEDGKRLTNVYEQGWRDGTETVDVWIEFDVIAFDAPTSLTVTDIVVR